jgi:hypothetical protein
VVVLEVVVEALQAPQDLSQGPITPPESQKQVGSNPDNRKPSLLPRGQAASGFLDIGVWASGILPS